MEGPRGALLFSHLQGGRSAQLLSPIRLMLPASRPAMVIENHRISSVRNRLSVALNSAFRSRSAPTLTSRGHRISKLNTIPSTDANAHAISQGWLQGFSPSAFTLATKKAIIPVELANWNLPSSKYLCVRPFISSSNQASSAVLACSGEIPILMLIAVLLRSRRFGSILLRRIPQ